MLPTRSAYFVARGQLVSTEAAGPLVEYGEILVGDARDSLTIAQMVDQKVLAMLGSHASGFRAVQKRRGSTYRIADPQKSIPLALSARSRTIKAELKDHQAPFIPK